MVWEVFVHGLDLAGIVANIEEDSLVLYLELFLWMDVFDFTKHWDNLVLSLNLSVVVSDLALWYILAMYS